MLRRDGVRRDSAGPPARRRPKTPSPSVTPAGVGGPRAAESREPPRRRGGRAAERRLRDPCPPAPPPRGAPAPPGPGSQEASLPRPADQLRCRAGAGVMEETPPPPSLGGRKPSRCGRRGGGRLGARGPSGLDPGPLPGKVRVGLGRSERPAAGPGEGGLPPPGSRRRLGDQPACLPRFAPARPPTPFPRCGW